MITINYKNKTIVTDVLIAETIWSRFTGYMFRIVPHQSAILFKPAISIHTFFVNFSLDVVFMDSDFKILKIYRHLAPWRHTWFYFSSSYTLEMPAGNLPKEIKEGDRLEVHYV
jgi:uncharacterized membrane protein (UPF0127 family)